MLIDWTRIHQLREEIGDENFAEVVTLFLEESDTVIARADSGLSAEDLHFLKGASLNLGFTDLAQACVAATDPEALVMLYRQSKSSLLAGAD